MARKRNVGGRRADPAEIARQDGGDPVSILGYAGNPVIGTAVSDFLLAQDAGTVNGGGGDDFILGDIGPFGSSPAGNNSFATAYNFNFIPHIFSTVENPLFADDSIPHATVYVPGENQLEFFQIDVGAGQTLTIDIDGAGGTVGSAVHTDTVVELFAAGDLVTPVASNDDADAGMGGYGSEAHFGSPGVPGGVDSFLVFTNNGAAATYYVRIREFGVDANFEPDDEFLLNISLTGGATGGTTHVHGDILNGEAGNDHLYGGAGNDTLNGGSGLDFMVGGTGDDLYIVDDPSDFVVELADEGNDRISARSSFQMSPDASVETLTYFDNLDQVALLLAGSSIANTITAATGADLLRGFGGNDILYGLGGNDRLDGGTGADVMDGGAQSDIYYVDDAGDVIVEVQNLNGGIDTVYADLSYVLAAGVSVEKLSTSSTGAITAIDLIGNDFANEIYGNAGANFLDGGGGDDYVQGFGGNDTYVVDSFGDLVVESIGGGRDVVYARANYILTSGAEVEVLSTISQAATTPLQLTGNALRQEIYGNAGANFIDGGAGAPDYMAAFGGDDTYVVNHGSDYVFETAGGGRDVVYARTSFTLTPGSEVEVLSVISQAGGVTIDLTGNALVNELYGNTQANFLDGGGGADYMQGFAGNDTYVVEVQGDVVVEGAGEGSRDAVFARASYVLAAGQQIEVLAAISQGATTAINLTGNELANELYGNAGASVLNGGAGADYLQGFGGADTFAFTTALGGGNVDQLADFSVADDTIALDDAVFTGLTPGALPAGAFVAGSGAGDADDRIVYNSTTGQLFYDADGNGAGAAVLFATLSGAPALTASDFQVI